MEEKGGGKDEPMLTSDRLQELIQEWPSPTIIASYIPSARDLSELKLDAQGTS